MQRLSYHSTTQFTTSRADARLAIQAICGFAPVRVNGPDPIGVLIGVW